VDLVAAQPVGGAEALDLALDAPLLGLEPRERRPSRITIAGTP